MQTIHVQHPDINNSAEAKLRVDMLPIHELPPRGTLRRMADIYISVDMRSQEYKMLNAAYAATTPLRIRTDRHVGLWSVVEERQPARVRNPVRLRLVFSGLAEGYADMTPDSRVGSA